MWPIIRRLWILLALLTLATPAWAQQACTQSDIAGVWELYIGAGEDDDDDDDDDDLLDDDADGWSACRVRVGPQGGVRGPCETDAGSPFRITGGQLNVRNTCLVTGRVVVEIGGRSVALAVPRAALSRSGDLIAGGVRAGVSDDLFSVLFQMVRL